MQGVRWGPVVIGAAAGLFVMVFAGLVVWGGVLLLGGSPSDLVALIVLTLALFTGQLLAGYVAGRFTTPHNPAFHGSLGGLLLYAVFATLSLAAGSPAPPLTLILFAVVALVIGMAGGALASRPSGED